jgi:opacity protein-like surface antigen
MKKLIFGAILAICCAATGHAQGWERRKVDADFAKNQLSFSAGLNGWQIVGLLDRVDVAEEFDIRTTGTYGLNYDFFPHKNFSIGASLTTNRLGIRSPQAVLFIRDQSYSGRLDCSLRRTNLGLRLLGHYVNNERFGLYSGLRIGLNWYRATAELETDDFQSIDVVGAALDWLGLSGLSLNTARLNGTRPTLQVVPLGARFGLTDNIGLHIETALGPTSYLSGGVHARF